MPQHARANSSKRSSSSTLPSKDEVLAYISDAKGELSKRQILRAFNLPSKKFAWLKDMLKQLERDGALARRRGKLHQAGALPQVVLADVVTRDRDGELIAEPVEWDAASQGPIPKILVTTPRKPQPGQFTPGVGERALLRIEPSHDATGPAYTGRAIKIVPKGKASVLGIFRALPGGGGRIASVDKRNTGRELSVRPGDEDGAQDGDLVSVSLMPEGRIGLARAKVRERLGSLKSERAISLIAIHQHGIPMQFSRAAVAEAEAARPFGPAGREDWRNLPLVTIDPVDAKDHDDAVHAAPDTDPQNRGGFVLSVAIADVAAYVKPGSALDKDALERGNSVYFPDRVVPMLPERISNDLCSLQPSEPRAALALRVVVDANGRKKRHTFHRVLMRSAAKLAYTQAQAAIDGHSDDTTAPLLDSVLKPLWAAYGALARARDQREPLDLNLPERKLLLKEDRTLDRVVIPPRLDAHRLIEEFMILANVCAAETLERAGSPLLYRVHDEPTFEKMQVLGEVMASINMKLPKGGVLKPALFNRILAQVAGGEHQTFINEVVLRSQAQAEYAAENYGHFGLNLRRYAHFTSPIRRYADLIVHRSLIRSLGLGDDGLPPSLTREELAETAARISAAERRAMAAERETVDRLIAHFMAEHIGATFEGQISGVTRVGLFVKLVETGADGFIPASTIGDDYYRYEERRHAMVGNRTGETFRLGDRISVKLVEAAPVAGALRFAIMSHGRAEVRGRAPKGLPGHSQRGGAAESASARREAQASRKAKKRPRARAEKKAKAVR